MSAPLDTPLTHHTVSVSLRPVRTVTALPSQGWRIATQRMLEAYSRKWGGAGDILLPVGTEGTPRDEWLPVLAAFDADVYATYQASFRGHHLADPQGFERWVDEECAKAEEKGRSTDALREFILTDPEYRMPRSIWRPSETLVSFLEHWMSPGGHDGHTFSTIFTADARVGRQAGVTDLADLRHETGQVWTLKVKDLPSDVQLLLDTRLGAVAPLLRDDMANAGVTCVDVTAGPRDLSALLELAWTGTTERAAGFAEALAQVGETTMSYAPQVVRSEIHQKSPFKWGLLGCGRVHRLSIEWHHRPIVIVTGDTADDFALAMALDRGWGNGLWFPPVLLDDELRSTALSALSSVLVDRVRAGQNSSPVLVTSVSGGSTTDDLLRALRASTWAGVLPDLTAVDPTSLELIEPWLLADLGHMDEIRTEPFLGPNHAGSLNPPLRPSLAAARSDPYSCQWMVDIRIEGHQTPDRQVLKPLVHLGDVWDADSVRPTASGLAARSHREGFVLAGATVEQMLARHRLRTPAAEEVFARLLGRDGYQLTPSSAGRYTTEALHRWGGLDEAVSTLSDTDLYRILHVFADRRSNDKLAEDRFLPGVIVGRRRVMTIEDMARVASVEPADLISRVDGLVARKILRRGFVLKCSRCSFGDWYSFGGFSQSFQCGRCGVDQILTTTSWRDPVEAPLVYYDLDEIVFQLLDNDGAVVLLALAQMKGESRSFSFVPESEVIDEGGRHIGEVDLLAIVDGDVVVGEAKRGDRLSKSGKGDSEACQFLCAVAKVASADRLVLATASDAWSETTLSRANEALQPGFTGLVTITGVAPNRPAPLDRDVATNPEGT